MSRVLKVIAILFVLVLFIIFAVFMIIWANSPGKLPQLTDKKGALISNSISEKHFVRIGNTKQGFFIRGENPTNPVLLYLHGGPGSPELPMIMKAEKFERLEKYFTVCYWDQRGAGMSYNRFMDPSTANIDQMVEDTREMTEILIERYDTDKIYLMGHSWGSYLGVKTIEAYPEYYKAYIGTGQVTDQLLSEQLAYDYMLNHAREIGDEKAIRELTRYDKNAPDFPSNDYLLSCRIKYMNKYGIGLIHEDASLNDITKDILFFKGYTLSDKWGYLKGNRLSQSQLFHHVIEDNLFESSNSFKVPVFVIHGLYDYQVSHELARKWVDMISAPQKGFYSFQHSAHSPNLEEPEEFVSIVNSIVENTASLINEDLISDAVQDSIP